MDKRLIFITTGVLEKATAHHGGPPTLSLRRDLTDSQQIWLGEEVQVEAAQDAAAVETAPADAAAEEVAAETTEPGQQQGPDSPKSSKVTYLTLESNRPPI